VPDLSITLRGASSSVVALCIINSVAHADDDTFLRANSLVISSSTYDPKPGSRCFAEGGNGAAELRHRDDCCSR